MEIAMAMLLTAAYLYRNALSLVLLAFLCVGMAVAEAHRRLAWRLVRLPCCLASTVQARLVSANCADACCSRQNPCRGTLSICIFLWVCCSDR